MEKLNKNQLGFGVVEILLVLFIIVVIGGMNRLILSNKSYQTTKTTQSNSGYSFPKEQRFTNDKQSEVLVNEFEALDVQSLGTEYQKTVEHQGVTGGFYAGQPIGASINACYTSKGSLLSTVQEIEQRFTKNQWTRHDPPGYNLQTVLDKAKTNSTLSGYNLLYTKSTTDGIMYGSLGFASCTDNIPSQNPVFTLSLNYEK